jgi:8-oxo-dGTP pyrophosphatase MutT (NUDIX family)
MSEPKRLRASAICSAGGYLLVVRLRDPVTGEEALYPPGGAVEPGESPAETARRETLEETGLHVRVHEDLVVVDTYPFRWAGVDREITTYYFAAALEGAFDRALPKVEDADYNLGAAWVPIDEAMAAIAAHAVIASAVGRVIVAAANRA